MSKFTDIKVGGSCFTGIGGGEIAFESFGINSLFGVEIGEFQREVLKKRFPRMAIYKDVKNFWKEYASIYSGQVDIISGGFPCTNVSVIGKKEGFKEGSETQSSLAWDMLKVIEVINPKYVFLENVENIMSKKFDEEREKVFNKLVSLGYGGKWCIYGVTDIGGAHKRNRFWMLVKKCENPCIEELKIENKKGNVKGGWPTPRCSGRGVYTFLRKDGKTRTHICDNLIMKDMRLKGFSKEDICNPEVVKRHINGDFKFKGMSDEEQWISGSGGRLHPNSEWIEMYQGFPIGYTNLDVEEPYYIMNHNTEMPMVPADINSTPFEWEPEYLTTKKKLTTNEMEVLGNSQHPFVVKTIFEKLYYAIN